MVIRLAPAENEWLQWLQTASPERLNRLRPHLEEFRQLLGAEVKELIGSSKSPLMLTFLEKHREVLMQAELACMQQAQAVQGPLRDLLQEYYGSMGAREMGVARMSRVLPLSLSELLPGFDRNALIRIIGANVWGYEALRIQDDFVDEPDRVRPAWVLLIGLFVRWCTESYCTLVPDLGAFFADYARHHEAMNNAILAEQTKSWSYQPTITEDLKTAGRMADLIRLCASTMVRIQGQPEFIPTLEQHLDAYLMSRQLLDDLQDFADDVAQRRTSMPINLVWGALGGERVADPSPELLQAGFLLLPVVPRCLELLRELSELGLGTLSSFPDAMLYRLMAQRLERIPHSLARVEAFRNQVWTEIRQ